MRIAYVYIRPSPYLGGWWVQQHGLNSSWGLLPIGTRNTARNPLADDFHDLRPFPTEEAAWEQARAIAEAEAVKRGGTLTVGTYQGTFGVWRAWVIHD